MTIECIFSQINQSLKFNIFIEKVDMSNKKNYYDFSKSCFMKIHLRIDIF